MMGIAGGLKDAPVFSCLYTSGSCANNSKQIRFANKTASVIFICIRIELIDREVILDGDHTAQFCFKNNLKRCSASPINVSAVIKLLQPFTKNHFIDFVR